MEPAPGAVTIPARCRVGLAATGLLLLVLALLFLGLAVAVAGGAREHSLLVRIPLGAGGVMGARLAPRDRADAVLGAAVRTAGRKAPARARLSAWGKTPAAARARP